MNIDLVITELAPGGAERCLAELAVGLAETGDRVRVCSIASLPSADRGQLVDKIKNADIPLHSCECDHSYQFVSAYQKLAKWMQAGQADLCQTFLFHANVLGTIAAERSGTKKRVGGLRVAEPNRFRELVERWAVRRMDSLVCVSDAVQLFALQRLNCPSARSIVIPNGVDVSRFAGAPPLDWSAIGWPRDAQVILFVGRMHPQKGIDQLRRHIDRLIPKDTHRRMLLVGDGPQAAEIDAWIEQVGDGRIKRLPWQPDVAPLMRSAQLLILPSRYEGMPNVILEAMAAGRPVVCSRVEGIDELLPARAATSALQTYRPGDEAKMLDLVDAFCTAPETADEVGASNQAEVRNHFSMAAMIDAYRRHYRERLRENSAD
tara:strand:+ start:145507 stop:146634 length:1128 start_codon:yes stop_codon:yes gene_type:complete